MPQTININLIIFYAVGIVSTVSIGFIMFFISSRYDIKLPQWLLYLLVVVSGYMFAAQYLKYFTFHFYGDFAHWAQVFYNISTTWKPLCISQELHVPGTFNYFSAHFVPLLYILAIPYRLLPYNETIIFLNVSIILSAAIPMYKLALNHSKDKRFAFFMVILLIWYPTFQYTILYEFEMLRFSIPIILWMLYFWQKKQMVGYYIFLIFAVLVREEVGLTIMMFGIYLLLIEKQRRTGLISALVGLMAFVLITQLIMPSLRGGHGNEHIAMKNFTVFGNTMGEVIINIILDPVLTLKTVFQPIKLANVFMYFLPLLFIPFLAPSVLVATLANFGVGLLSSAYTNSSYMLFYLSPSIPFIFYAFIKGWPRFVSILDNIFIKRKICKINNIHSTAMIVVFSGLFMSNVFFGPSPFSLQFWFKDLRPAPFRTQNFHYSTYKINEHHRKAKEFYEIIPKTAIVSSHRFLQPRLYNKGGISKLGEYDGLMGRYKADYVFFDKTNNDLTQNSPAFRYQKDFDIFEKDKKSWKLLKSDDGYFLYKRK